VRFVLHDAIGEQPSVIRAMSAATLEVISGVDDRPATGPAAQQP
jgi:sirohydrochlorin cobaltochelatase